MTIVEARRFSLLVGEIYDAAVDPARRSAVLEQVAGFVGGSAVTILSRDAARLSVEIHQHYGMDARFRDLYRDRYVELDPLLDHHLDLAVEQAIGVSDVMPYSDFVTTSFYREWMEPQGAVDLATVALERSNARMTVLQVMRASSRGTVDDAMRERMRLIGPHIQRSRVMSRQIRARSHTVADLAEVLDRVGTAICLFDADGRVVHANAACRQMFADGDLLAIVGDRVVARNTQADKIFRGLLDVVAGGTSLTDRRNVELMTARGGQHYLAHAVPTTHAGSPQRDGVATALFLQKVSMAPQLATAAMSAAFKLTPSELRVLMAVVELGGVPEIAAKLGIAETTVKTHLSRLFEKTGAGRQADLVKIAAGFAVPFALPSGPDKPV